MGPWTAAPAVDVYTFYITKIWGETLLLSQRHRSRQLYLGQISNINLHVAALAGAVQPLHVHVERPGNETEHAHFTDKDTANVRLLTYLLLGT